MEYIIQTDQEAAVDIERIIYEYGDSLLRLCTIYLKDRQLAEDAVQETFIKVYQKYGTFNGGAQEKTWVMKIAMNT
ncbi:MAG: sigma factor, partial [Cellulosilyticaceae bacterium]